MFWKVRLMPSAVMRCGGMPSSDTPLKRTSPPLSG
jgi:hypothetical protein